MHRPISIIVFLILLILFQNSFSQETKLNIAVNDLKPQGLDKSAAGIISDRIRSELINTGLFRVMERTEMETILKEQGFQHTGVCDDQSCLVEVGQLLGVDRMVAGSVGKFGSIYTISLRMINVATGEILFTVNEDCDCPANIVLSKSTKNIALKLAKGAGHEIDKIALEGKTGDLHIKTDQAGASVEIDGKKVVGKTPLTLKGFAAGEHRIVVRKGNWYGSKSITLEPYDLVKIMIPMSKGKGWIKVFSDPSGALVYADDRKVGETPLKIEDMVSGEHIIKVVKDGYLAIVNSVKVGTGETQNISVTLKRATTLSVDVYPRFAAIFVNDKKAGTGSVKRYKVAAGDVNLQAGASGFEVYRERIKLTGGEHRNINVRLVSIFGVLNIGSEPTGASIFINDKNAGNTPLTNYRIKTGDYTLKIALENYETIVENINIKKNRGSSFKVDKLYTLTHTKTYLDSVSNLRQKKQKRSRLIRRIIFGSITACSAAAGFACNYMGDKKYEIYSKYKGYNNQTHEIHWEEVELYRLGRNISYSIAGAAGLAFVISIPF